MWPSFLPPRKLLRFAPAALAVAVLLLMLGGQLMLYWLDKPVALEEPTLVELPEGANLTVFLAGLQEREVLDGARWLRYYARATRVADRVHAGEYLLQPGVTPRGILRMLVAGEVQQYALTIIEGTTIAQLRERLGGYPKLRQTLDENWTESLLPELAGEQGLPSLEGAFFPDTYYYNAGMSDRDVLKLAYRRMQQILEEEWQARSADLPYRNSYEALIMASLVEKETGMAAERADIAGVFVRRLRAGMLLQTDPAVIYGLGPGFDGNLTRKHLQTPGPYNTYMNAGLPPTPIALAGREAIAAALHPADGETLFFVARGDGSHEFSVTLAQHNAAVRKFQKRERARNYRSRPQG